MNNNDTHTKPNIHTFITLFMMISFVRLTPKAAQHFLAAHSPFPKRRGTVEKSGGFCLFKQEIKQLQRSLLSPCSLLRNKVNIPEKTDSQERSPKSMDIALALKPGENDLHYRIHSRGLEPGPGLLGGFSWRLPLGPVMPARRATVHSVR